MIEDRHGESVRGAMLAFAVGDALGWPLEMRANRVGGVRDLKPELKLRAWVRREGGGYAPHEEEMPAGVYSDDTQLVLAVARSLQRPDWWEHMTRIELPWWPQYELGGGGATKRASQAWAKHRPPWEPSGAKGYWTAGGNGVAMRILPHCFRGDEPFGAVRRRVLADGVATHGDPVALVGAQLYAFALWSAMSRRGPLGWGQMFEEVLDSVGAWGEPDLDATPPGWREHAPNNYDERWRRTVDGMVDALHHARNQMAHGALAMDDEVLEELGCFSKASGAGTVTAAGALYLASRHAAEPDHGLVRAAFARGADTDTLAAMTGALLGALHGPDWLGDTASAVMDADLLAHALNGGQQGRGAYDQPYERSAQRYVEQTLAGALPRHQSSLPFYGEVEVVTVHDLDNRSSRIRSWWLRNREGQTFRIKRMSRAKGNPWIPLPGSRPQPERSDSPDPANGRIRSGLVVRVRDLGRARTFYESIIGLPVSRETSARVVLGGWLALEHSGPPDQPAQISLGGNDQVPFAVTLYTHEGQFSELRQRLVDAHTRFTVDTPERGSALHTTDPDGTPVEIRLIR